MHGVSIGTVSPCKLDAMHGVSTAASLHFL